MTAGVDDTGKRLIIVSGDFDARSAATSHYDIQTALPGIKVITLRPIAANIGTIAKKLAATFGKSLLGPSEFKMIENKQIKIEDILGKDLKALFETFSMGKLNVSAQLSQIICQLANHKMDMKPKVRLPGAKLPPEAVAKKNDVDLFIEMERLVDIDVAAEDRALGVCPILLFNFKAEEAEVFQRGHDLDKVRDILIEKNILQYFYPPADQLILGMIERGDYKATDLPACVDEVRHLGHPLAKNEFAESTKITSIIDELQQRDLAVSGTIQMEITDKGMALRSEIKYEPRESCISKVVKNTKINLDVSSWFKAAISLNSANADDDKKEKE